MILFFVLLILDDYGYIGIFSEDISELMSNILWFSQKWLSAWEWCEHKAFLRTTEHQPDEAGEGQSACLGFKG